MAAHATLGASKADQWIECPGSIALSAGKKNTTSTYADWGTAAHELASWCLTSETESDAAAYLGRKIAVADKYFTVDDEMVECVQRYVDIVREYVANTGGHLLVEHRVDYSAVIGVPESFGTADAIILAGDELIVIDLKTGRGEEVDAFENKQMRMYALGALEDFGLVSDFNTVRKVIVQPRINWNPSEHVDTVDELNAFAAKAARAGQIAMLCLDGADDPLLHLNAGEKQCRWCKAKATCPALAATVAGVVRGAEIEDVEFTDNPFEDITAEVIDAATPNDYLLSAYNSLDLVKGWMDAVLAEAYARGERGEFPGHKMVNGKRGARAWSDPEAAEATLKAMRLKVEQMYKFSLQTPTQMEKVLKENPRKWKKVEALIVQPEGKPVLVPVSDKRPALPTAATFEPIQPEDDLV